MGVPFLQVQLVNQFLFISGIFLENYNVEIEVEASIFQPTGIAKQKSFWRFPFDTQLRKTNLNR